jgi:hypothetical protein
MTTKNHGKYLVVEFLPTGGVAGTDEIVLSAKSRNFKVSRKSAKQDVSVREDVLAGNKDFLLDAPETTISIGGLDTDVNAPEWEEIDIDDTGTLTWYRRGKVTGRPKKSCTVRCSSDDSNYPFDNAVDWSRDFEATSTITAGTVA